MTPLLSCRLLTKTYSSRPLFRDITLGIATEERMGLIGPNGSGKSTLLRVLTGIDKPDSGEIARRRDLRLVYLPQEDDLPLEQTVTSVLESALENEVLEEYEKTALLNKMRVQFGFADMYQIVGTLSGGWRKRLALARAFIQRPELLLMDEPTNHLDVQGVRMLESLLQNAPFAFLLISHDRYFLENVTNRIVELSRAYPDGYLRIEGNYSEFLTKKQEFLAAQAQYQDALETQVKREVAWLRRGAQARTTKSQYRIQEAGKLIGELAEVKYRNTQDKAITVDFTNSGRKTRELIVAKDLEKSLGGRLLFSQVGFTLSPGVKLGLLGANGSGKTTLLKLIAGEMQPDAGTLKRAEGLRIVRFDQDREQLNPTLSLRNALSPNSDNVDFQGGMMHVSAWAGKFLFRPEQLDQPVGALSGGEQARVLIANLMLRPADILILDEPTNDLDIPSLEVMEECLEDFPGAVVLVTHDRYMLDTVSTELLALDGNGGTRFFADLSQWEREEQAFEAAKEAQAKAAPSEGSAEKSAARKLASQELREWNQMEARIMEAEEEVATLQQKMSSAEVATDPKKLQECWDALHAAGERVTKLYARWEELDARRNAR